MPYTFTTDAYQSFAVGNYHSKSIVMFIAKNDAKISSEQILAARVGFEAPIEVAKSRHVAIGSFNGSYNATQRADLIVTDNPTEIFGYIDPSWIRLKFKIVELVEHAKEIGMDTSTEDWVWVSKLTSAERSKLLARPINLLCNGQRKTVDVLLGFTLMSWDEFSSQYTTIVQPDSSEVLAFPKKLRDSYRLGPANNHKAHTAAIIFGEHRQKGETLVWIANTNQSAVYFNPQVRAQASVYEPSAIGPIDQALAKLNASFFIRAGQAELSFRHAPSLLRQAQYTHHYPQRQFLRGDFESLAKALGVRGYSTVNLPELIIKIGEAIATLPPRDLQPALLSISRHEVPQAGFDNADAVDVAGRELTLEDYMAFFGRAVSGKAYVPGTEPSPGRIVTDGKFSTIVGVSPLDILNDELV